MSGDGESDMEYSDNDYDDYYNSEEDSDIEHIDPKKTDPEYFDYKCLLVEGVEKLLNELVEKLSTRIEITPSLAKVLLHEHEWNVEKIVTKYRENSSGLLISARVKPPGDQPTASTSTAVSSTSWSISPNSNFPTTSSSLTVHRLCPVCATSHSPDKFEKLACNHSFCKDCWAMHFETQIFQGITTQIGCMAQKCNVRVPEDLVLNLVTRPVMRDKYQQFAFRDYVKSHPELRFCPGPNCNIIVRSTSCEVLPKRTICEMCQTQFCFKCGMDYHAPTNCQVIRKWLTKCADDSETANYISANTKDCPNVIFASKKMGAAITCIVFTANMTFAGCVWVIGRITVQNTMNVLDIKKIQILPTNRSMLRPEKPSRNICITMRGGRITRKVCNWNSKLWTELRPE
uniref:RBR-type E3 ubiquitin transferase n=1 Tax=Megaselia scalaris TaxID=36166 RepID=T1GU21_MEGSC